MPVSSRPALAVAAVVFGTIALPAAATINSQGSGLDALHKRIGVENTPTGAGVVIAQVEAGGAGNYGPNMADPEFAGKTFIEMNGPGGGVFHPTEVGRNLYGYFTSIAPDIDTIYVYEANAWLQSTFLHLNLPGTPPEPSPAGVKLFNNSWIGNANNTTLNNDILRRADFVVVRDDVLMINGVNNTSPNLPLLAFGFNGISVGMLTGGHASDDSNTVDGGTRQKPELVAPGHQANGAPATSWSAGVVSGAAAILIETARTMLGPVNPNADRSEVIKAVLLCGADHEDVSGTWTNNAITSGVGRGITATPIDHQVGAGELNIDRSHLILTGGEHNAAASPPAMTSAPRVGWDLVPQVDNSQSRWWRFDVNQTAAAVSILITWHRLVPSNFSAPPTANFNLILWRVNELGELAALTGDENAAYFTGGNVISQSTVDNIEHLYIEGLAPGNYTLELRRTDLSPTYNYDVAVAWHFPAPIIVPGDIDEDGDVDVTDLLELLAAWGSCPGCPEDLDDNGNVNVSDLLMLLANWSP
jgi:hypothetical protein